MDVGQEANQAEAHERRPLSIPIFRTPLTTIRAGSISETKSDNGFQRIERLMMYGVHSSSLSYLSLSLS